MIQWYGKQFEKKMRAVSRKSLKKAAVIVVGSVKESMKDSGIPSATRKQRRTRRSKPGEPPHVDTSRLKASIAYELVGDDTARVGTNVVYGRALELGFAPRNLAPRPYLRPALARERDNIVKAFAGQL